MVLKQLEKDSNDIMAVIKKEKTDRERDTNQMKDRIDNERKEMQILIDKDRDNFNNKIKDEHDQRRIEQMELVQRVDNNEKCGSTDIKVSFFTTKLYIKALFINKWFALNEMFQRNASKFAIFHV